MTVSPRSVYRRSRGGKKEGALYENYLKKKVRKLTTTAGAVLLNELLKCDVKISPLLFFGFLPNEAPLFFRRGAFDQGLPQSA